MKSMFTYLIIALSIVATSVHAGELPKSPEQVAQAFERYFNESDVNALLTLYPKGAVFVPAPGQGLKDKAQIKEALNQFLSMKLPISLTIRSIYQSNDTALIISDWIIKGNGPDGKLIEITGSGADVVKRDKRGNWLYSIDNPFGVAKGQ